MLSKGIKDGIPIGLGYFSVSFSFGILAVAEGLTWWEALLISMTNLTSAGQFAGLTVMTSAGSLAELAMTQFIINLRYALMSISLSQKVNNKFKVFSRAVLGFGITDEVYAVAMGNKGTISRSYFTGLIIIPYIGWALGTLGGAICGNILPEIICDALGIALYGMFIAIVLPPMKHDNKIISVVAIAIIISLIFNYVPVVNNISSGFTIIISSVVAAAIGALLYPKRPEEETIKE